MAMVRDLSLAACLVLVPAAAQAQSSFGMGGTNAHVVVEEAPALPPTGPSRRLQLVALVERGLLRLAHLLLLLVAGAGAMLMRLAEWTNGLVHRLKR